VAINVDGPLEEGGGEGGEEEETPLLQFFEAFNPYPANAENMVSS
jgi:hypothetical protein